MVHQMHFKDETAIFINTNTAERTVYSCHYIEVCEAFWLLPLQNQSAELFSDHVGSYDCGNGPSTILPDY